MSQKISDLRVVVTSSAVSFLDVSLNAIVGLITGSTVLWSQALQGMSDLTTGLLLLTGVKRSRRIADTRYQFGYGREIFFWVLIAGLLMFLGTGGISVFLGYQQIIHPDPLENTHLAVGLLIFNAISNGYAFSLSVKRLRNIHPDFSWWQQLRRSSIVETKATLLVDFMGTLAAFIGLGAILAYVITNNARFDGLGSIAIGVGMMVAAVYLVRDVRSLIVGRAVDESIANEITVAAKSVPGVSDVLDLRTMYLGSAKLLVIIEVHLEDDFNTDEIELITDTIKQTVQTALPEAHHIQVEVETPDETTV